MPDGMTVEELRTRVADLEARRAELEQEAEAAEQHAKADRAEMLRNRDLPVPVSASANADTLRRAAAEADVALMELRADLERAQGEAQVEADRGEMIRIAAEVYAAWRDYLRALADGNRAMINAACAARAAWRRAVAGRDEFLRIATPYAPGITSLTRPAARPDDEERRAEMGELLAELERRGADLSAVRHPWNRHRPATAIDLPLRFDVPEPFGRTVVDAAERPAAYKLPENAE